MLVSAAPILDPSDHSPVSQTVVTRCPDLEPGHMQEPLQEAVVPDCVRRGIMQIIMESLPQATLLDYEGRG